MLTGLVVMVGLLSHIATTVAYNVVYTHDCIVGSPPTCNNSLANDPLCRGMYSSDIKAWENNNCDCEYLSAHLPLAFPSKNPSPPSNALAKHE